MTKVESEVLATNSLGKCFVCGESAETRPIENETLLSVDCENKGCGPHIIVLAAWPRFEEWMAVNRAGRRPRLKLGVCFRWFTTGPLDVPILDSEWLEKLSHELAGGNTPRRVG